MSSKFRFHVGAYEKHTTNPDGSGTCSANADFAFYISVAAESREDAEVRLYELLDRDYDTSYVYGILSVQE